MHQTPGSRSSMPPRGPQRGYRSSPSARHPTDRISTPQQQASPRGNFRGGRGYRGAPQRVPQPVLVHESWRDFVEVSVKVRSLPHKTTTRDVWELLKGFGNIASMDVWIDRDFPDQKGARVTYCPPPRDAFWTRALSYRDGAEKRTMKLELMTDRRGQVFETPRGHKYSEKMSIDAATLDFGFMYQDGEYMIMRTIHQDVSLTLDLRRRELAVYFTIIFPSQNKSKKTQTIPQKYKFNLPISQLHTIWEVQASVTTRYLVFPNQKVPEFYSKRNAEDTFDDAQFWSEWRTWWRQTDVVINTNHLVKAPLTVQRAEKPMVDIGQWTTYRLKLDSQRTNSAQYNQIVQALRDHNIDIFDRDLDIIPEQEAQVWSWLDPKENGSSSMLLMDLVNDAPHLTFPVRYQLEACISQGIVHEQNIDHSFIEKLGKMRERDACAKLEHAAEGKRRFFNPERILSIKAPRSHRRRPNSKWVYTRLVTVTPSKLVLGSPSLEVSNRVVRAFSQHAEHFIRVRFTDENEGRLYAKDDNTWDPVFNRIKRCLDNGIKIGGHHFQFLASGNSQFRDGGAFFFAPATGQTPESIRQWMGYLEKEQTPAKVAARLGQCFSTTLAVQGVTPQIIEGGDVIANGFTFTDGVGKISHLMAQHIAIQFNIVQAGSPYPSLFQFRMGGCKGVLAVEPMLKGLQVYIRPSQYKFAATTNGLEVIRWSCPGEAALNRQIISILHCLRVPDEVFIQRQTDNLNSLERAMVIKENAQAMLRKQVDAQQSTLDISDLLQDFMDSHEPFVTSLLHLWRAWKVKKMKEKAAIAIDKGTFLFGTTDETRTLQGHFKLGKEKDASIPEIFVQVTDLNARGKARIIEGTCIVARNPSLHPGDVRVVRAVDNVRLHHLRDVVVFPQTGDQDIPSMCSGGDLDGDEFLVIWDEALIPPQDQWNQAPMDFAPKQNPKVDRIVTKEDLVVNFVNHMKKNNLARIAINHLASTDYYEAEGGARHPKCLEMAELHSIAVDFPKTGLPAQFPKRLKVPRKPHFMVPQNRRADDRTKYYHSRNILGTLYDSVDLIDFEPLLHYPMDERILHFFQFEPDDPRLEAAKSVKMEYDYDMGRIMNKHGIGTEFEVWTSFILNHDRHTNDYRIAEEIGNHMAALRDKFEVICYEAAGGKDFNKAGPFAAAMYIITARSVSNRLDEIQKKCNQAKTPINGSPEVAPVNSEVEVWEWLPKMTAEERPLISFPWILSKELAQIARSAELHDVYNDDKKDNGDSPIVTSENANSDKRKGKIRAAQMNPTVPTNVETSSGIVHKGETLELFGDNDEARLHGEMVERSIVNPAQLHPPTQIVEQRRAAPVFWNDTDSSFPGDQGNDHANRGYGEYEQAEEDDRETGEVEIDISDDEDPLSDLNAAVQRVQEMRLKQDQNDT